MLRPVHRVPHRTNRVFSGLVSLRGQLQLCVSMHGLLDVDPPDASLDPSLHPRLVVIRQDSETWAFPADEVVGVHRVARDRLQKTPSTLATLDRQLQPGRLRLGRRAERRRPRRAQGLRRAPEDGSMSDDLSGFSLMDLFRSEADGQIALLTEGLLALEGEASPSPAALEALDEGRPLAQGGRADRRPRSRRAGRPRAGRQLRRRPARRILDPVRPTLTSCSRRSTCSARSRSFPRNRQPPGTRRTSSGPRGRSRA